MSTNAGFKPSIGETVQYLGVYWMCAENQKWSGFASSGEFVPFLRLERINPQGAYETVVPASIDLVFPAGPFTQFVTK